MPRRQLRAHDLKQIAGYETLAGVDEAGRGALAGPVVAAAVLLTREFLDSPWARKNAGRINDSKQLTPAEREDIYASLEKLARAGQLHASHGAATVDEIEHHNILGATKLAMRRALQEIYPPSAFSRPPPCAATEPELFAGTAQNDENTGKKTISCRILIDGLPLKNFPYPHTAIIDGDARSLTIAMASIIAKVTRDRLMLTLDAAHPAYGYAHHKGYATEEHRAALLHHGPTPQHRKLFLRKLLATRVDPAQLDFLAQNFSPSPPANST